MCRDYGRIAGSRATAVRTPGVPVRWTHANTRSSPSRATGLHTPRWLARMQRELDGLRDADGRLGLTFEIVYGHAFKPTPPATAPTETQVSLEAMRSLVRAAKRPA